MLNTLTTADVHVMAGPGSGSARALEQLVSTSLLPGVAGGVLGLPGMVEGCAFPNGAVACFDARAGGVLVPGIVGPDINCGLRLLRSDVDAFRSGAELAASLAQRLSATRLRLDAEQLSSMLVHGAGAAIARGFGVPADVDAVPGRGCMPRALATALSTRALRRGTAQLGTLGSGHAVSVLAVAEITEHAAADALGLREGALAVLIHADARGLGYQTFEDVVEQMLRASERYHIRLPDRQLACAPLASEEAAACFSALSAASNFAFANRQLLTHLARVALADVTGIRTEAAGLTIACDVPHNFASYEDHRIDGRVTRVCVHRRGAARALPAGHPDLPRAHRATGTPVIIVSDDGDRVHLVLRAGTAAPTFDSLPLRATLPELAAAGLVVPVATLHRVGQAAGGSIDRVGES